MIVPTVNKNNAGVIDMFIKSPDEKAFLANKLLFLKEKNGR